MGPERKSAVIQEKNRQLVAYHEGGHAIVAIFTSESLPVYKATIMPRGQALGMVRERGRSREREKEREKEGGGERGRKRERGGREKE